MTLRNQLRLLVDEINNLMDEEKNLDHRGFTILRADLLATAEVADQIIAEKRPRA